MLVDEFGVELEPEMADLTRAEAGYLKYLESIRLTVLP